MAHELQLMEDGTYSMARSERGDRTWHGLENVIPADAPFDTWFDRSGLNFEIRRAPVEYGDGETHCRMDSRSVLFRGDNWAPLSVVSSDYNIVQPRQVLEFFRDLCDQNHLHMETAGCIRGGLKFWAMASTGHQAFIGTSDVIKQYVLLASSADSSMATTAKHTAMRVVCSNTFHANVNNAEPAIRVRHSTKFSEVNVKLNLGLLDQEFDSMTSLAVDMHRRGVTPTEAMRWYAELLTGKDDLTNEQVLEFAEASRLFKGFMEGYERGPGAEQSAWGLFNGVTYVVDHVRGRGYDTRLDSAWFGQGASLKTAAWNNALALVG